MKVFTVFRHFPKIRKKFEKKSELNPEIITFAKIILY